MNTSINHLDWSKNSEKRSGRRDFSYLELEGGAGWEWGSFYGFMDIENPTSNWDDAPQKDLRLSIKPIVDINIVSNWSLHFHDFLFKSQSFYINNFITGIAYKYSKGRTFWIKPFIGTNYQNSTYYSGKNGYAAGWVFKYNFTFKNQNFTFSQWHEYEFDRNKDDYQLNNGLLVGDGKKEGINGALAFFWHINKVFTAAMQYRYANYELGYKGYQNGMITTLKYNF
jgi:nucleoside-specific outer membrane channel protein Tsx